MSSRVLVTGGASGIGAACVERLQADGARLAVLDRAVPADGVPSADAWRTCDVTQWDEVSSCVDDVARELGGLDGVVACAGIIRDGSVVDTELDDWAAVFAVNVGGVFHTCRAAIPHLRAAGGGSIVLLGSQLALTPEVGVPAYVASKGAVHALGRALAVDHAAEGIRVNVVCPGPTLTPMNQAFFDSTTDPTATRREVEATMLHRRMVEPAEVADAVAYLLSPRAGSTIGATLVVDGGYTIR